MTEQVKTGPDAPTASKTTDPSARSGLRRLVSVLDGIRPYQRGWLQADIVAGITLAALAIPEVMGYTKIAGMPVITGLYTILIPIAAFALFGSSRHLVVGADSATARSCSPGSHPSASPGCSRQRRSGSPWPG